MDGKELRNKLKIVMAFIPSILDNLMKDKVQVWILRDLS